MSSADSTKGNALAMALTAAEGWGTFGCSDLLSISREFSIWAQGV